MSYMLLIIMFTIISCCVEMCCFSILIGARGLSLGSSKGFGRMIIGFLLEGKTRSCFLGHARGFEEIPFSSEL